LLLIFQKNIALSIESYMYVINATIRQYTAASPTSKPTGWPKHNMEAATALSTTGGPIAGSTVVHPSTPRMVGVILLGDWRYSHCTAEK